MYDPIVDEVRRVREQLIERHGGLRGYIKHLQTMDREHARTRKKRTAKKLAPDKRRLSRRTKSRTTRTVKAR